MRYQNPRTPLDSFREFVFRGGIPVTTTLLVVNAVTFLLAFVSPPVWMTFVSFAAFNPEAMPRTFWTLFTYPLFFLTVNSVGLWNFLIGGLWLYQWGGSLERSFGSKRYAQLFAGLSIVSALFLWLGCAVLHQNFLLYSFYLPLAGVSVAFGTLHPEEIVSCMFFPLRAKYVAMLAVLFTIVVIGEGGNALLGIIACGGLLASYLYIRYGRSWSYLDKPNRTPRGPDLRIYPAAKSFQTKKAMDGSPLRRSPFDLAGRWRDWQERRRLEALWRNSGLTDDPEDETRRR